MQHNDASQLEPNASQFPTPLIEPVYDFLKGGFPSGVHPASGIRSLHLNECAFPPSDRVLRAMELALRLSHRYPDDAQKDLTRRLSQETGVEPERIVVCSGSSELLYASARLAIAPGDEAVLPTPNFPAQPNAIHLAAGRVVPVALLANGCIDVDGILSAITEKCRLVFVTTPNNPTGGMMAADEISRLAEGLPQHVLLHFDEAYFEFGRIIGAPDALPMLSTSRAPWIVTRTFSKAYGLAGIRLGYGIASSRAVAEAYRRIHVNFNVNVAALAAGVTALEDRDYVDHLLRHIGRQRDRLARGIEKLGYVPFPSAANFVTFRAEDAEKIVGALGRDGIYTMSVRFLDRTMGVRVTIGSEADTNAVFESLLRYVGSAS